MENVMERFSILCCTASLNAGFLDFFGVLWEFFSKFTGSVDTKLLQLVLLCQWISTSSQIQDDESPSRNRKGVAVPSHPKHVPIHTDAL